jgi:hypothetical protein
MYLAASVAESELEAEFLAQRALAFLRILIPTQIAGFQPRLKVSFLVLKSEVFCVIPLK